MAWAPMGKLPALESADEDDVLLNERVVETAAVPCNRFVKKGTADGSCKFTGNGERPIGVTRESLGPRADTTAGTFSNYAVGDKAVVIERTANARHVLVETDETTVADGAPISATAAGKAQAAASGHNVAGFAAKISPLVTSRDGTKYIRLIPNWMTKEVAP